MKEIKHFKSAKERLDYIRGGFEEIVPQKAKKKPKKKKGEEKDEVQAE